MTTSTELKQKLSALRDAFDLSFAAPAGVGHAAYVDFLTIRVAGDPYALRLSEVASVHADRKLVTAPSLLSELVGIAGFRGVLTPVYDLGAVLGYPAQPNSKWLVLTQHSSPIGFAFEVFDAHLRVAPDRVSASEPSANAAARGAVHSGKITVPLLHLPSLVEGIAQRIKAHGPSQER